MDEFTLKLLTNCEVLDIHQDEKATPAIPMMSDENGQVWVKDLTNEDKAIGLFNLLNEEQLMTCDLNELGFSGLCSLRDVWRHQDLGMASDKFSARVPAHGVVLICAKSNV